MNIFNKSLYLTHSVMVWLEKELLVIVALHLVEVDH